MASWGKAVPAALLAVLATGCSHDSPATAPSTADAWKPGNAVVVLVADIKGESGTDFGTLVGRHGVIAVSADEKRLKVSLSRQALLTDMAQIRLELEKNPALSNVREVVVPPSE